MRSPQPLGLLALAALATLAATHGCAAAATHAPTPRVALAAHPPARPAPPSPLAFHTGDVLLAGMSIEGDGELDEGRVRATIQPSLVALRRCYLDALAATPALRGRVLAEFTVNTSGRVFDAVRVRTPERAEALAPCVAAALRALTFPVPVGGALRAQVLLDLIPFE